jgi:hypothetical protein
VHGSGSPELLKSDAPGVKTTRARVRDGLHDMVNPPRATAGLGRPLSGDIDGGRGFAWRRLPACDAPGVAVALKLRGLAQQVEGADVLLTEGLGWVEVWRRVTVDNGRWRRRVGLRGKGRCRGALGFWTPWIIAEGSCDGATGFRSTCGPPVAGNCCGRTNLNYTGSSM